MVPQSEDWGQYKGTVDMGLRVLVRIIITFSVVAAGTVTYMPVMHAPLPCMPYGPSCCGHS